MKKDIYEGYDEEARAYFEALDYAFDKYKSPKEDTMQEDDGSRLMNFLEGSFKVDAAFDRVDKAFAALDSDIPDDEWRLLEEAHQRRLREENPPAPAFSIPKPSWFQRLLDWLF